MRTQTDQHRVFVDLHSQLAKLHPELAEFIHKKMETSGAAFLFGHPCEYGDPLALPDIFSGVRLLQQAIVRGELISLFGDKDVDGITAIVSFVRLLESIREKQPQLRYEILVEENSEAEYGLTQEIVEEAVANGSRLLVALDTGTSDFASVARAREAGLAVLILDHHETKEELPQAEALINPKRPDSAYPFAGLSTAGLVFKFFHAFFILSAPRPLLFLEFRHDGELERAELLHNQQLLKFSDRQDLAKILPEVAASEQRLRVIWSGLERAHALRALEGIAGFESCEWEAWSGLVNRSFQRKVGSTISGFDLWGNALTGLDSQREWFASQEAHSLREAYQILQITVSEAIFQRLLPILPFVAIGTLADLMPLVHENRIFVRTGLYYLRRQLEETLRHMIQVSGLLPARLRSRNISWSLTPVLNSPGRIGNGIQTLRYFLNRKPVELNRALEELFSINRERKDMVEQGKMRALDLICGQSADDQDSQEMGFLDSGLAIAVLSGIPVGVSGLIASRVADHFRRPATILIRNGDKATGSARAYQQENVLAMVDAAKPKLLLYGGHHEAAGFSLQCQDIEWLQACYRDYAAANFADIRRESPLWAPERIIELPIEKITPQLLEQLDWLEPFGIGNEEPIFLVRGLSLQEYRLMGKGREHIKIIHTMIGSDSASFSVHDTPLFSPQIEVIGWNLSQEVLDFRKEKKLLNFYAEMDLNNFRNSVKINLFIKEILK